MNNEHVYINEKFSSYLDNHQESFDFFMSLDGKEFRSVKERKTLQVKIGNNSFFVKKHFRTGYREILKNIFNFKLPILGAKNESIAIKKLDEIGIPTTPLVAYGEKGCSPATKESFILTLDLGDIISLETLCKDWINSPPTLKFKRELINAVAELSGRFHSKGLHHRDFYLCHICLDSKLLKKGEIHLYLIDLHRAGVAKSISETHQLKDLSALYFSAMHIGLSQRDILRFILKYQKYFQQNRLIPNSSFLKRVTARAIKLDEKYKRKYLPAA
ncbi:MAG: lipopolysaccharide core heptose(I) kinase RfaP [Methylotenera sp.]|nr:lipopolysaccharide core heptose(I) kinase RfaP [Methylotenera sp.]MDP2404448.1 lipopolysaccharide core heptose(I) kinase RfaP [Methylotenera sp.]MDP3094160.1 lipopolysaccharide core heptose(I) kinase RfaP [Methylotenera sp.]MDZ4222465.1 lipopolysaccharide core heptose(I) kinase RfaP [Methylotenera sp.]